MSNAIMLGGGKELAHYQTEITLTEDSTNISIPNVPQMTDYFYRLTDTEKPQLGVYCFYYIKGYWSVKYEAPHATPALIRADGTQGTDWANRLIITNSTARLEGELGYCQFKTGRTYRLDLYEIA